MLGSLEYSGARYCGSDEYGVTVGRPTNIGVKLSLVQVLDNLLDGRDRPIPELGEGLLLA